MVPLLALLAALLVLHSYPAAVSGYHTMTAYSQGVREGASEVVTSTVCPDPPMDRFERQDCLSEGGHEADCLNKEGCCWSELESGSLEPWCYYASNPTGQPSSEPSDVPSSQPSSEPSKQPSSQPSLQPTCQPSSVPSRVPSGEPSSQPSRQPTSEPSGQPSSQPSSHPTCQPSSVPSHVPSGEPSSQPSRQPTSEPSGQPSARPTGQPSGKPSSPTGQPSSQPSFKPSGQPTGRPSGKPSVEPSAPTGQPSSTPSGQPTLIPSSVPSSQPTGIPTNTPWKFPTSIPSQSPTSVPTAPSAEPTTEPSGRPTGEPSNQPSSQPSGQPTTPTGQPSALPSCQPTGEPSTQPSGQPSGAPTSPSGQPTTCPSSVPSGLPTGQPSGQPSGSPSSPSSEPTAVPSCVPSNEPSSPSSQPSMQPTSQPSNRPSGCPSSEPTRIPTVQPSNIPSSQPSGQPTATPSSPSGQPSGQPSAAPSCQPSGQPSGQPSSVPTSPSGQPTSVPSGKPTFTFRPSHLPSALPSAEPTSPSGSPTGEPSCVPSGHPSGEPSLQPSAEPSVIPSCKPSGQPSMQPSGCPSGAPTLVPSGTPTTQPSSKPSSQPISVPSAEPSSLPSSLPSTSPSSLPSVQPTTPPTRVPSSQPSGYPSGVPSCQPIATPSNVPSSVPSLAPSSFPSFAYPKDIIIEKGTTNESLSVKMIGLGHQSADSAFGLTKSGEKLSSSSADVDSDLYLRVEIIPTAFPYKSAQYVSIFVNGNEIMKYCAPGIDCGTDFYSCLADYDIAEHLSPESGGSLEITVTSTGLKPSICDYNGYPLYVRFTIHDTNDPQTQAPSIHVDESTYNSLSSFNVSYHVKPGFMLSMAAWGALGALFGMFMFNSRNNKTSRGLVVSFAWYKYGYFAISLASCWSYMSAALGYMISHDSTDVAMGVLLLCCQIAGATTSVIVSVILYSPTTNLFQLSTYIEPTVMIKNARAVVGVSLVSLTDPSLLIFLPWKVSEFCVRSKGYPNFDFFRAIVYFQSFMSTLRCVAILVAQQSTSSTLMSLFFSVSMLVLSLSEAAIKLKAENIQQFDAAVVSKATLNAMKFLDEESGEASGEVEMHESEKDDIEMKLEINRLKDEIELLRLQNRESMTSSDVPSAEELYLAKLAYADENVDILKVQLQEVGMNPLEYIPLPLIEAELAQLTRKVNNGETFDEKRLDHLLACMERNPQYRQTQEQKRIQEREKLAPILVRHLATMRAFVPPTIFSTTLQGLQDECGYSKALAKRLMTKKCLWLLRMNIDDIMKLHEVDLTGKYGHGGQTLDIVEKTALLAALPSKFDNDARGIKKKYLLDLEGNVMKMIQQEEEFRLSKNLIRNPAYKDQQGKFDGVTDMYAPDVISSEDAFSPRMSFRSSTQSSPSFSRKSSLSHSIDEGVVNPLHDLGSSSFSRHSSISSVSSCSTIGQNEMSLRKATIGSLLSRDQSVSNSSSHSSRDLSSDSSSIGKDELSKRREAIGNIFK